jgi:hypothetical protein
MHTIPEPREPDDYRDPVYLFNGLFQATHNTVLVPGDAVPEYRPADRHCRWNRIIFAHGFYASALHETSHWCIAGAERRKQYDYGYWYQPDGRSVEQQAQFEKVESRPQALEWILTIAAGRRFHLSLDNLDGEDSGQHERFAAEVHRHTWRYLENGLPGRAERFRQALMDWYGRRGAFAEYAFSPEQLL